MRSVAVKPSFPYSLLALLFSSLNEDKAFKAFATSIIHRFCSMIDYKVQSLSFCHLRGHPFISISSLSE
uniref:Uncharacterized protein n=1 Tax=Capsicum annuum TaxID=4072 RepID=F2VPY7_CAPAN|nr:unknown [Capsicum annuum]